MLLVQYIIVAQVDLSKSSIPNISCHIEDWNTWKNDLYVNTSFAGSVDYLPYCYILNDENDTIYDISLDNVDTLNVGIGDSVGIEYFVNMTYGRFYDSLGEDYELNRTWPEGTFKLFTSFLNPTDSSILGMDSCTFITSKNKKPALLFPHHTNQIDDSLINYSGFEWTRPDLGIGSIYYKFYLVELDSENMVDGVDENDILNLPNIAAGTVVFNVESYPISSFAFEIGKNYAWSVQCFEDLACTQEIGANHGMAYVNKFSTGVTRRGDNPSDVLRCNNGHSGFEDEHIAHWDPWHGVRQTGIFRRKIKWTNTWTGVDYSFTDKLDPASVNGVSPVPIDGGNHSLRIGDVGNQGGYADRLSLTFVVTPDIVDLVYNLSSEIELAGHNRKEQPYIQVEVTRRKVKRYVFFKREVTESLYNHKSISEHDPYVKTGSPNEYMDWDCFKIDLSNYIGEKVTINLVASDCSHTAHGSEMTIDFCVNNSPDIDLDVPALACFGEDIIADGSATEKLTSWLWTFEECDAIGTRLGNEQISKWYFGSGPETFNFSEFLETNEYEIKCNSYYRVKLAGSSRCSEWTEEVKIIQVICPALAAAGPDKCSPNHGTNVQIGANPIIGYTYSWSPSICLSSSTASNPTFTPLSCYWVGTKSITYTVTVTDPTTGCVGNDEVTIFFDPPTIDSINFVQGSDVCKQVLTVYGDALGTVTWKNSYGTVIGTGNPFIVSPKNQETYTAVVTNPCGTASSTITLDAVPYLMDVTNDLVLIYPNAIKHSSNIPKNTRVNIYEFGIAEGVQPAYGAIRYELDVKNRWGEIFTVDDGVGANFENGEIVWDGKIGGSKVQQGVYHWGLKLWNCRQSGHFQNFKAKGSAYTKVRNYWTPIGWAYKYYSVDGVVDYMESEVTVTY